MLVQNAPSRAIPRMDMLRRARGARRSVYRSAAQQKLPKGQTLPVAALALIFHRFERRVLVLRVSGVDVSVARLAGLVVAVLSLAVVSRQRGRAGR